MNKDLKSKTLNELEQMVSEIGQKRYLGKYIFSFIHTKDAVDISQITTLSKDFRSRLAGEGYYISQLNIVETFTDPDGTVKYLFELSDGNRIETVLLTDKGRRTLCVSTQVGCAMDCEFCSTAKLKFRRNLTAGEIADQVNTVQRHSRYRINNVVYMGMGEPLRNYDAVLKSVHILNHPDGKNIGMRHLTISTCGEAKAVERLAGEEVHPRLAVSLNAPNDPLRTKLMPINKKYPISALLKAVSNYQLKTKLRVTFEYVLIKGLNDTVLHARILAKLLRALKCNVNLIEYNPRPGSGLAGSGKETIERFARILSDGGIETTIRFKKGRRIKAACGQLGADWLERPKGKN